MEYKTPEEFQPGDIVRCHNGDTILILYKHSSTMIDYKLIDPPPAMIFRHKSFAGCFLYYGRSHSDFSQGI